MYTDDAVLPRAGDDGAVMVRWKLIAVETIPKLNEIVLEVVHMTQGGDDLVSMMQCLVSQDREAKGLPSHLSFNPTFAHHTSARYDALALL
jgi:hypothetical protein